jgi:16S rRNA (cytosine1402-N4)-methyltransferase
VDGVLADLGVSSYQFDTADRGFSFRFDAQLDMRMNSGASLSAYEVVNKYDEEEFLKILISYGEFRKGEAVKIFRKINEKRSQAPIKSTKDLCQTVSSLVPSRFENKFLAKLFQSIRIEVNNEMQALEELLCQLPDCVSQNGVVVFITYHSIEDRMVKNFFKSGNIEGNLSKDFYGKVIKPFEVLNKKPIVPSDDEISNNSRARSAKLRMAKRV